MRHRAGLAIGLALLLTLLAYCLRVYRLNAQSVWFDEGWSWYLAGLPLDQMARVTAADRSPFLYYTMLHAWIKLAGETEFAMRYLSVCADVTAVALILALGKTLSRNGRVYWLAGLLYAVCPLAVWYAQETRMYALMAALCLASCYWLWRWVQRPKRTRMLVASAVLLGLAIYTHYYAVFLLPAQGLAVVFVLALRRGGSLRAGWRYVVRWIIAALGIGVALAPWLAFASAGFAYDDGFVFPLNTITGRLSDWITAFAGGGLARALPGIWQVLLAAALILSLVSAMLARRWREGLFLGLLIMGSLFAATTAVRVVYPYRSVFHPRYLIYVAPLACVLLAGFAGHRSDRVRGWGAIAIAMRLAVLALVGLLWLPALLALYNDPSVARDDVRDAVRHVVEALRPGDLVVMTRDNYAVRYYLHTQYPASIDDFIAEPDGLHGMLQSDAGLMQVLQERQPTRVRLFLWQDDVVDPQRWVESTLWANGYEIGELDLGQIRLPLYQLNSVPVQALSMQPVSATFGSATFGAELNLTAFWMRQRGTTGDWFYAVLAWQPEKKLSVNYKVFVQVWDAQGHIMFQQDKLALNSLLPTSAWTPGSTLRDAHAMIIPSSLAAGEYRVVAGVYDPAHPSERLHAESSALPVVNDGVILGALQVRKR